MRKCANNIFLGILLILILIIVNCVPSSYQSPRVLRPGEKAVGAGFALAKGEYVGLIDPFLCFRYGVFKKWKFNTEVIFSSCWGKESSGIIVVGIGIRYVFLKKK